MNAPDLRGYRAVHVALRQAAHRMATASLTLDPTDRRRATAFARYWEGYADEIVTHHRIEDDFVLPALVAKVPAAQELLDRTAGDHHHLDELLASISAAVLRVVDGRGDISLAALLHELAAHVDGHLDFEDAEILTLIESSMTAEEYAELDEQAMKSMGLGKAAAFAVPFIASYQTPEALAGLMDHAPLPIRLLYKATRRSHARLARLALTPTTECGMAFGPMTPEVLTGSDR